MDENSRGLIKFRSFLRHVSEDNAENYEISETCQCLYLKWDLGQIVEFRSFIINRKLYEKTRFWATLIFYNGLSGQEIPRKISNRTNGNRPWI